jgi:hypothetical protein
MKNIERSQTSAEQFLKRQEYKKMLIRVQVNSGQDDSFAAQVKDALEKKYPIHPFVLINASDAVNLAYAKMIAPSNSNFYE